MLLVLALFAAAEGMVFFSNGVIMIMHSRLKRFFLVCMIVVISGVNI